MAERVEALVTLKTLLCERLKRHFVVNDANSYYNYEFDPLEPELLMRIKFNRLFATRALPT